MASDEIMAELLEILVRAQKVKHETDLEKQIKKLHKLKQHLALAYEMVADMHKNLKNV